MERDTLTLWLRDFVRDYPGQRVGGLENLWLPPLLAVASAQDPLFDSFKTSVHGGHLHPRELMQEALSVIVFFVPFVGSLHRENYQELHHCSRSWAAAYIETNRLIADASEFLKEKLTTRGKRAVFIPPTHNFDRSTLMSDWSHRHAAYAGGLGRLGVHNLLITSQGCSGRLGSLVTDLDISPSPRPQEEFCLHKAGMTCLKCVERCEFDALRPDGFDRFACHAQCRINGARHRDLGKPEICGKCSALVPCSTINPNR
jgi:epoxyqueuosine reductase QueG